MSSNIKATQNRIWSGVTKDVGYLRRILNELYILKFKVITDLFGKHRNLLFWGYSFNGMHFGCYTLVALDFKSLGVLIVGFYYFGVSNLESIPCKEQTNQDI